MSDTRPLAFIFIALAVWRLTSLLVREDGPGDFFAKLRYKVGVRYDERSNAYGENVIAKGLTCIWCTSVWVSVVGALVLKPVNVLEYIVLLLALSAAAIVVDKVVA